MWAPRISMPHANRVLQNRRDFTLDGLVAAAYDNCMTDYEKEVPAVVAAWNRLAASDPLRTKLAEPIAVLCARNTRWDANSAPLSVVAYGHVEMRSPLTLLAPRRQESLAGV